MFGLTVSDAVSICNGIFNSEANLDEEIIKIVIDSRSANKGDLFVAYKGEKSDGHDYIRAAFDNGATAALAERIPEGLESMPIILVDNVQVALESLIKAFRQCIDCPVIGVTGSVGKTTTKEMISSVLSNCANVCKTEGNYNNLIGVPMSMSSINQDHDVAVIEMGISIPGEMNRLAAMVHPTIMVYTNIGHAHLEFLGSLDGVFNEKICAVNFMHDNGILVMNGDDPYFRNYNCKQTKVLYGTNDGCDVVASNIIEDENIHISLDIAYKDRSIHVCIPVFGRQMVYAALAAAAVGFVMGLNDDEIVSGINNFRNVGRRSLVESTGYITLIDDTYNSNLDSCKSSIDSFVRIPGRHVAILGDFLEQGEYSVEQHKEIGDYARSLGVESIIGVGEFGKYISDVFYLNTDALIPDLPELINKEDIVLVKASRGVHLDTVSDALKKLS